MNKNTSNRITFYCEDDDGKTVDPIEDKMTYTKIFEKI